jgi:hypothetical protein
MGELGGVSGGDGGGWSCSCTDRAVMGSGSLHGGGAVVLGNDGSARLICGGVVGLGSCSGGFSNEKDGGVSFVGCFSGRFSKGEGESTCEELGWWDGSSARDCWWWDGSSAQDCWNWIERAAIISSTLLVNLSSISCQSTLIELNLFAISSNLWSATSQRGSDTKLLRSYVTGDGRW